MKFYKLRKSTITAKGSVHVPFVGLFYRWSAIIKSPSCFYLEISYQFPVRRPRTQNIWIKNDVHKCTDVPLILNSARFQFHHVLRRCPLTRLWTKGIKLPSVVLPLVTLFHRWNGWKMGRLWPQETRWALKPTGINLENTGAQRIMGWDWLSIVVLTLMCSVSIVKIFPVMGILLYLGQICTYSG